MRSTFWSNRILEPQSSQNRHAGLKFSPKRENSAPSMKIVQNAPFRSCAARSWPNRIFERQSSQNLSRGHEILSKTRKQCAFHENFTRRSFKIVTLAWNSLQNRKTVRFPRKLYKTRFSGHAQHVLAKSNFWASKFSKSSRLAWNSPPKRENSALSPWKLYKTLLSGHAQHVLAKSHFWSSKFSKSSRGPEILWKTRKQCAFHENFTRRSFQVMRISSKQKNSALSKKIVQNPLFRSCAARFGQIEFLSVKVLKIVSLAWNSPQNGKTVHFPHENCTKRSFQVMRSTFWPNRIFDRQSSQNRHAGLKFFGKRENSAPSMKILHDALFRSCAFLQNRKTVRFPRKLYKTRFSGHAQHVLAKSDFWAPKFSKSWNWPQIFAKTGKQCAFHENCTKRSFQVMRSTFWPNRIFERQISQIRETGLKFSSKRIKSALFPGHAHFFKTEKRCAHFWASKFLKSSHLAWNSFQIGKTGRFPMKIVQNALFRSCAARFGQIAFLSVKVLKIVTRAWNSLENVENSAPSMKILQDALFRSCASLQNRKTVRFPRKLYKTRFSGHAQHVLAKSHFWASKFSKSSAWPEILVKTGKQCTFPMKIVQNASFRSCAARFGQIAFLIVKVLKIVTLGLKFSSKTRKQCALSPMKILHDALFRSCAFLQNRKTVRFPRNSLYKTRFSGHAQHVLAKSDFWAPKFSKSWNWPQISRSKLENSALSMKIVQNALFRSCAARFGQIAFLSGKFLKFVKLASNSLQSG